MAKNISEQMMNDFDMFKCVYEMSDGSRWREMTCGEYTIMSDPDTPPIDKPHVVCRMFRGVPLVPEDTPDFTYFPRGEMGPCNESIRCGKTDQQA